MKVSIITATYNSAATLRQTLTSVAKQSYPFIEHIIVDNCSTDETLQIAREFPHVAKIVSEKDKGLYDAMNKGIALATGDIIGILNSDDYLASPESIALIAAKFKKPNIDAVYGNLIYVDGNNPERIRRVWIAGGYQPELMYRGWMLPHPTLYVRKEVYETFGGYNTTLKYAADYEMMLRLLLKYRIRVEPIREVLVYMATGGVSNQGFKRRLEVNKEDRMAWELLGLKPKWYTLCIKPVRKLSQYVKHYYELRWMVHIPPACDKSSYMNKEDEPTKVVSIPSFLN